MAQPFIRQIPPQSVVDVAKLYRSALARSFAAAGEKDARACLVDLVMGRRQLWAIFEPGRAGPLALFRTEIVADPEGAWLCVSALAGRDLRSWGKLLGETMTDVAREIGCKSVRFAGRAAWGRVLPEFKRVGDVSGEAVFERAVG